MLIKHSHFSCENETGPTAIPLFGPADGQFEKTASAGLLPVVSEYIEGLRPVETSQYVLVNAMGAGEFYGCFPAGTLVTTSNGEKPIEAVEPGEQVLTHKNRFKPVVARVPKQAEELCDLKVQSLPSNVPALTATPNHELWVVTREDFLQTKRKFIWKGDTSKPLSVRRDKAMQELEFSWMPISDLRAGDYVAEAFPLEEDPKALGDEKWNCPEVAYLMGLYAAEGCTVSRADRPGEDHYVVYVTSSDEEQIISRIEQYAAKFDYTLYVNRSKATSIRAVLSWQDFARLCRSHVGKLGPHKVLSADLLRMPRGWQKAFLAAYAAGDGCVRKDGKEEGAQRMVSASAALLRGMRILLARNGLVGVISGRHNKKASWYNGNPIYELSVSGGQLNGRGTPKSYLHPGGYILSSVKCVEQYAWEGEVFDLTVEEDSSFVASGIVVHNSNINGDHFPEAGLIHKPDDWADNPVIDRIRAKSWAYGFPTFYLAHPYAHHKNKDAGRAFGEVELAAWNPHMKRVELVTRIDHDKCCEFGGMGVWDKLKAGGFPDVSMGSKVPFDRCSICLDQGEYKDALATYNPKKHKHPGQAVLDYHRRMLSSRGRGIRGLSITRKDYCEHARTSMNKILPDGRKVFVYNDFPRFFDISFVFIGADRTAKTMLFIFSGGVCTGVKPSSEVSESITGAKTASAEAFIDSLIKESKPKAAEIKKDHMPSNLAGKAVPLMTKDEKDIPREVLDQLGNLPLEKGLSTLGCLGVVLRPREFQRVVLTSAGKEDIADDLDSRGLVFPKVPDESPVSLSPKSFLPALLPILTSLIEGRSGFAPAVERRVVMVRVPSEEKTASPISLSTPLMRKIGAAYNGYRTSLMDLVTHAQNAIEHSGVTDPALSKLAGASVGELFTPLSAQYLTSAFKDEVGYSGGSTTEEADVERVLPL